MDKISKNKFFDKYSAVLATASMDYPIDQLRQCLESEGVTLSTDDTMKVIDLYIRICGFDGFNKEIKEDTKLTIIHSLTGFIECDSIDNEIEDSELELLKNCIKEINDHFDYKIENIDSVINGAKYIIKEVPIFLNEIINNIIKLMEVPDIAKIQYISISNKSKDDPRGISFTGLWSKQLNKPALEIVSNISCNTLPEKMSIVINSFPEEDSVEENK